VLLLLQAISKWNYRLLIQEIMQRIVWNEIRNRLGKICKYVVYDNVPPPSLLRKKAWVYTKQCVSINDNQKSPLYKKNCIARIKSKCSSIEQAISYYLNDIDELSFDNVTPIQHITCCSRNEEEKPLIIGNAISIKPSKKILASTVQFKIIVVYFHQKSSVMIP
jgi:hypothetical protein